MKKFMTIIVLMLLFAVTAQAAVTHGTTYYLQNLSHIGSGNKLIDPLYLFISETETAVNSSSLVSATGIVFEGATANDFESTLAVVDATADRTITLQDATGYVPLIATGVLTFPSVAAGNGATISNAVNNQIIFGENSEDLNLAFGTNAITVTSSTGVTSVNWGTVLPTFGGAVTLQNGGTIGNATNNAIAIGENSEDLVFTFSANAVALSSTTGVTDIAFGGITQSGTARQIITDDNGKTVLAAESGGIQYCTGAGTWVLPEASTVLGRPFTFVNYAAGGAVVIDPADGTDVLLAITNSPGDSLTNSTAGNTITLTAVNADNWVVTASYGTWTDNN